jgi:hypothetical protein
MLGVPLHNAFQTQKIDYSPEYLFTVAFKKRGAGSGFPRARHFVNP